MASLSKEHGESLKLKANTPHFFKIILDKTLRDGKLGLPCKFVRNYGNDLPSSVQFNVFDGAVWQVELTKSANGEIWWQKGWQEFVDHYSLARGHLLVFEFHHRTCHFNVLIFDKSASEIDYPPCNNIIGFIENNIEEECQELQTEGTENDDAPVKILDNNFSCLKSKGKSSMPVLKSHKKMKVENSSFHGSIRREVEGNRGYRSMPDRRKISHAAGIVERTQRMSFNEKTRALNRASSKFHSKNPFFMVVMQPSFVSSNYRMAVPELAMKYFKKQKGIAVLNVSNKKTWIVKCYVFTASRSRDQKTTAKITYGWREFAQDNQLKIGDVCAFELIKATKTTFKVSIFRCNKGENC